MKPLVRNPAFGAPGIDPRWTRSDKEAVGTAYSASSRIWFTLSAGIVNEVYYPTIDRPQIRDLQFLVTDGRTFFHDERRDMETIYEPLSGNCLGFRVTNTNLERQYRIEKEIITDPHYACLLIRTTIDADESVLRELKLYALLAPHLDVGGRGNSGYLDCVAGHDVLMAFKNSTWLAMGCSAPLLRRSCGYVGASDGWTDLSSNFQMDWQFDAADSGNIALMAEIDLKHGSEFTLAVALGDSGHDAQTTLLQSLGVPFARHKDRFIEQWQRICAHVQPLTTITGDGGALYRRSHSLILAHEDKAFPGALIASLSIPWGQAKGDEDLGGYHLVWPRDMVHASTALLAGGNTDTPYRSLIYLACCQSQHGGFHQNFWINGDPYWTGIQLDQVSFAILLAWRVKQAQALQEFDPYPMVLSAASFLVQHGPATAQERWEENSGYSPSTLAANIAALCCAAAMARERSDGATAQYLEDYADFLESHIERWTVTNSGTLVSGISRHFVRILPLDVGNPDAEEDLENAQILVKNQPPGARYQFPAKEVVDGGFLELVRYGIRSPHDPIVVDSVEVVDRVLRVELPQGPCWRRYNHDGYGQCDDGRPYITHGRGRPWPLLTGERGHYELAAGRDARPYLHTLENFGAAGLLPEQVWDLPDLACSRLRYGGPTGSAMPLVWAHSEYLTLVRSIADGQPFDLLPHVVERYQRIDRGPGVEFWKANRHAKSVRAGQTLRVQAGERFLLHWSLNQWSVTNDTSSSATRLGLHFVDIAVPESQRTPVVFTLYWPERNRWEGRDYSVRIESSR